MPGDASVTNYNVTVWLKDGTKIDLGLMPENSTADLLDSVDEGEWGEPFDGGVGQEHAWAFPTGSIAFATARKQKSLQSYMDQLHSYSSLFAQNAYYTPPPLKYTQ